MYGNRSGKSRIADIARYQFAISQIEQGHTVLFRDPATMRYIRVRPQDWQKKVAIRDGVVYVNGKDASGWTVCKKP